MKNNIPPIWLILLSISLYGTVFLFSFHNTAYTVRGDSLGYLSLAKNIRENKTFSIDETPPYSPELFRLPGYPAFLGLINSTHIDQTAMASGIQCLLGIGMLFLAWPILLHLGNKDGAIIGSAILVLDLGTILHAPIILSEMLLQVFLVLGLINTVNWLENRRLRHMVLSAFFWGVASLIKPITLFIPILVCMVTIFDFKKALLFGLLAMILPASWAARNSRIVGKPVYTIQGGYALLLYPAANAYAKANGININEATTILENQIHDDFPHLKKGSSEESKAYNDKAKRIMKSYPLYTLEYCFKGAFRILAGTGIDMIIELFRPHETTTIMKVKANEKISGSGTLHLLRKYPMLIPVQIGYMFFLLAAYLLFIKGGLNLFLSKRKKLTFIFATPVLIMIGIAAHQGYYRFRLPLMPFVAFGATCFQNSRTKNANFSPLE